MACIGQAAGSYVDKEVAACSGFTMGYLVRFERGQLAELSSRKQLVVLAVLGMKLTFTEVWKSRTLDELRCEHCGTGA